MDEITLLKRKLLDTANRAYNQNIYTYTTFLSMSELSIYQSMKKELSFIHSETYGGFDAAERAVVQFGDSRELGYEGIYPIDVICVKPLVPKFSENLTHRDYLGAILNLGIERNLIGDIITDNQNGYIFCLNRISSFIIQNLTTIRHTHVQCSIGTPPEDILRPKLEAIEVIAASARIDAVVAALTRQSRSLVIEQFKAGKIYVNSFCCQNHSAQLKEGDILVIRHNGKFIYEGCGKETRKGRVYVHLQKYV